MMVSLSNKKKTDHALFEAAKAAKATVKEANRLAGRLISKGDYSGSERLIALAKTAGVFQLEISELRKRWREATQSSGSGGNSEKTPLWQYYKPILLALVALGGSATRSELERHLEASIVDTLKPGDKIMNAQGVPRWKKMVHRARRHMIKERFLEGDTGEKWVVTPLGRRALEDQGTIKT